MEIFINNVYYTSSKIEWVELVLHDQNTLKNSYVILDVAECIEFCYKCKEKGFFVEPLIKGEFSLSLGTRKTFIKDRDEIKPSRIDEKSIDCVYSLYWDLAKYNALFLDSEDFYPEGYIGPVTTFSGLRVSNSTMSLLVSIYNKEEQRWSSRYLIKTEGEKVEQKEFYCAIPKGDCSHFYKYGLKQIRDIKINNKDFTLFKYCRNLSIYRMDNSQKFPESLIVHYVLKSIRDKACIDLLKYAIADIKKELNIVEEKLPSVNDSFQKSNLFTANSGVFFKSQLPKSGGKVIATIYQTAFHLYTKLEESGKEYSNDVMKSRKILVGANLPFYNDFGLFYLMEMFKEYGGKTLDVLEVLQNTLDNVTLLYLEASMYLYSLRLNTYLNPSVLEYRDGENVFNISSEEGSVNVEVWSWS